MSRRTPQSGPWVRSIALVLGFLFAWLSTATAQQARPEPARLPSPNPLCDGIAVSCLEIDKLAGHAYAHLQVLPRTEQRDTGVVLPMGVTVGLFGRVTSGISTHFTFGTGSDGGQQFGPLRLSLTLRLWPLLPLWSSGSGVETAEAGPSHYSPPRGLQLGLAYEQEVRVWAFRGANSLGLLTDLAALRVLASRMFGPVQVSASLGALYDWRGQFATGEAAAQIGVLPPGFRALKIYVEALGRGVPTYVQKDALPADPMGQAPIHPQSLLGLGLSFRPHGRVDLGVSVQRGFSGLAPWAVTVQLLTLSVGKTYEQRAATPVVQLAADAAVETARAIHEYIKSLPIDPTLDERCMLLDDDGELLVQQPLGTRTPDGKHCLVEGERLPIGESWWRDRKKSVVCHDKKLTNCLMYRRPQEHGYRVLHRPWVGDDCVLRENVYDPEAPGRQQGQTHRVVELLVLGAITKDRTGCSDPTGYVHPIGTQYYREHGHLWICAAPRTEEQRDRCFLALAELPQKMRNQTTPLGRIARALDHGAVRKAQAVGEIPDRIVNAADGVAEGRITAGTVVGALEAKAQYIAEHASLDAAKGWIKGKLQGAREWGGKPRIEQAEDLAEEGGDALIPHPVTVGATIVTGGLGRGAVGIAEELDGAIQAGKQATRAIKVEEHVARGLLTAEEAGVAKGAVKKAVNLPGWKKVEIDMPHILERHIPGAPYAAGRTLFPERMSESAIERAVRQAYRYGETVGGQGERVMVRGTAAGLKIEIWVNKTTKTIETAYPVF